MPVQHPTTTGLTQFLGYRARALRRLATTSVVTGCERPVPTVHDSSSTSICPCGRSINRAAFAPCIANFCPVRNSCAIVNSTSACKGCYSASSRLISAKSRNASGRTCCTSTPTSASTSGFNAPCAAKAIFRYRQALGVPNCRPFRGVTCPRRSAMMRGGRHTPPPGTGLMLRTRSSTTRADSHGFRAHLPHALVSFIFGSVPPGYARMRRARLEDTFVNARGRRNSSSARRS